MVLRILLIDDNPHDRLLAIHALEQEFADLQIKQVIRPEELEEALLTGNFDVVITDYQLRWSDGITVLQKFKSRYPELPVVMFTNSGSEEISVEAMKSGLDDYVVKSARHYMRLPVAVRLAVERAATKRKVQGLELRFQTLLNQLNVGVYRLTGDDALLESNGAFLHLLGINSLTKIPESHTLAPYFQPGDYAQLLQELKQTDDSPEREVLLRRADGNEIWVRISQTLSANNEITVIDGIIEDITARKQAEQEREQLLQREQAARAEAEASNLIKDEFLSVLSHELRSPLNPILGWCRLLTSHQLNESKKTEAIAIIERNAKLLAQMIEDLLNISQILQGKLNLNIYSVDLVSIISVALESVQLAAQAKNIQMHSVLTPNVCFVLGDPTRLQQVFWNLLFNAIKFTPAGGSVEVRLKQVDTQAQIQVTDTGQGISHDFLPYVFDKFRQADSKTTRNFGGLGMGLAIVKHLVELHGGQVWAESLGEGQGSTFTVRLPLMTKQTQTNINIKQFDNRLNLSGIRVLLVDDEVDSKELADFILQEYGAEVISVGSPFEVILTLMDFQPDVLVLDIGMPDMDGYMLLEEIRSLPPEQGGRIPAIALTAYAGKVDKQQAISAGFQAHLPKPVDADQLVEVIAELVKPTF
ncbi:response regulator [Nostoc sp. FACHB-892]|uniref:ATP-binding response regulator n=1 Tax=Nostoc sp. FACHB-892 TaxID=2692843 RepID=UPI001686F930|nr:response regulator [Nostoc sp. FACHB-892]MBD2730843.1 response regulator [Nostoc sp. FACHB-892]